MSKIELLAPAGNFDCLVAAVQSGADAVYLSGKVFGARSFADNFNEEDLERAVDYCHVRNTKVYVTVNTLVSDLEMPKLKDYLIFLNNIGVDAIIVQDVGVVSVSRRVVPDLSIHASTQMTIHNSDGIKALESFGIKRVVLSREVSIENIKKIADETKSEIEVFAHGALCMCYSGQCLMSSIIGGRSGNRGKCAQPCRLPYSINNGNTKKFFMSLKDLSSVNYLQKLKEIGVSSLKIEGRMKGPAYVATVVGIYRKYIDNPQSIKAADIDLLDRIFNRGGVTDGYLTGKIGRHMFAFDKPDNPYLKGSDALEKALLNKIKAENRKIRLRCKVEIKNGKLPRIFVSDEKCSAEFVSETVVEKAENLALTEDVVKSRINKTGGTPFEFSEILINLDKDVFITAGTLNEMRRCVLERFETQLVKAFKRNTPKTNDFSYSSSAKEQGGFVCEVTSFEQFRAIRNENFTKFYVPLHIIEQNLDCICPFKDKIVIVLPAIIHENSSKSIYKRVEKLLKDGFSAVSASNIAQLKRFSGYTIYGGFRLNIFNSDSLEFYKNAGVAAAELSPELNLKQLQKIKKLVSVQTMVYGRIPLMVTENCIIRNSSECPCNGINSITDRMGMVFPVINDGDSCRSIILNCKKTFMAFDMDKLKAAGIDLFRIYFTDESPDECLRICDSFFKNTEYRPLDFTSGHYLKGVK